MVAYGRGVMVEPATRKWSPWQEGAVAVLRRRGVAAVAGLDEVGEVPEEIGGVGCCHSGLLHEVYS